MSLLPPSLRLIRLIRAIRAIRATRVPIPASAGDDRYDDRRRDERYDDRRRDDDRDRGMRPAQAALCTSPNCHSAPAQLPLTCSRTTDRDRDRDRDRRRDDDDDYERRDRRD